jgi:hypothetical protein
MRPLPGRPDIAYSPHQPMPINVMHDDGRRRTTAVATGSLSAADILAFVRAHRSGDHRAYRLLFDARSADPQGRLQDLERVAAEVTGDAGAASSRGATAIVATDRALELARVYESLCAGAGLHHIRVFQRVEQAEAWLTSQ